MAPLLLAVVPLGLCIVFQEVDDVKGERTEGGQAVSQTCRNLGINDQRRVRRERYFRGVARQQRGGLSAGDQASRPD